jgi:hypothetical protein
MLLDQYLPPLLLWFLSLPNRLRRLPSPVTSRRASSRHWRSAPFRRTVNYRVGLFVRVPGCRHATRPGKRIRFALENARITKRFGLFCPEALVQSHRKRPNRPVLRRLLGMALRRTSEPTPQFPPCNPRYVLRHFALFFRLPCIFHRPERSWDRGNNGRLGRAKNPERLG